MIKDLMHAIFNEDVDVEEEMDVESTESHDTAYVEPQIQPMGNVAPQFTKVEEPVVQEEIQPIVQTKTSVFEGLDVDDISVDAPERSKKAYSFDRKKIKQKRNQEEVEYQQVISPIFGNTEESKKEFNKVHDAISLTKPEDDGEGYSQIISPMFGASIPNRSKKVTSKRVDKPEKEVSYTLKDMLEKPKKQVNQQADLFSSKD